MANKNKNEDIYSKWYDMSNEFGKQFFDASNINNLNYGTLQESWKGYSERMGEQISKLMKFDEHSYKDMFALWNEFTENMNSQMSNLNVYENADYTKWYEDWLENMDKINKGFTEAIQKQLKYQTEVYEMNDLWLSKFGFKEEHKQKILDVSQIMSEYWLGAINKTTEIVKDSINPESKMDFTNKFQEFYDYLTWAYSDMIKQLWSTTGFEDLKDYGSKENLPNVQLMQDLITNNLKHFDIMRYYGYNKLYEEIETIRHEVDSISEELANYKKPSKTGGKK